MNLFIRNLWLAPFASFFAGYLALSFLYKNETLTTPSLLGLPLDKALVILSTHNLNARIINQKEDPDLAAGTIISQTPAPGRTIKSNQAIYLGITSNPSPCPIPDLCNKNLTQALKALEPTLAPKTYAISSDHPADQCIAQYPAAGSTPKGNTLIIYTGQTNAKPVIMPNLKNKPLPEVISFLSLHSITPQIIHANQATLYPGHMCINCTIKDQRPLPGSLITISGPKAAAIQLQVTTLNN